MRLSTPILLLFVFACSHGDKEILFEQSLVKGDCLAALNNIPESTGTKIYSL